MVISYSFTLSMYSGEIDNFGETVETKPAWPTYFSYIRRSSFFCIQICKHIYRCVCGIARSCRMLHRIGLWNEKRSLNVRCDLEKLSRRSNIKRTTIPRTEKIIDSAHLTTWPTLTSGFGTVRPRFGRVRWFWRMKMKSQKVR